MKYNSSQSLCHWVLLCGVGSWVVGWAAVPLLRGEFLFVWCEIAWGCADIFTSVHVYTYRDLTTVAKLGYVSAFYAQTP